MLSTFIILAPLLPTSLYDLTISSRQDTRRSFYYTSYYRATLSPLLLYHGLPWPREDVHEKSRDHSAKEGVAAGSLRRDPNDHHPYRPVYASHPHLLSCLTTLNPEPKRLLQSTSSSSDPGELASLPPPSLFPLLRLEPSLIHPINPPDLPSDRTLSLSTCPAGSRTLPDARKRPTTRLRPRRETPSSISDSSSSRWTSRRRTFSERLTKKLRRPSSTPPPTSEVRPLTLPSLLQFSFRHSRSQSRWQKHGFRCRGIGSHRSN
jgi:hypothetical protein